MIFRRFFDDTLAQASYMIGCERSAEAIVVDPNLDLDVYMQAARTEKLRIAHVTETHIHADFASGARALATETHAEIHLSAEGGPGWQYALASAPGVHMLHDGDRLTVGGVHLDVLHTPGHTPEHLTFLVTDSVRSEVPVGAVTGDFVFVGDVGRPDLLERAAGEAGTMGAAAATLYASVQRFKVRPDHLQLWPGHGAGSACGKALSSAAQSTLGYERVANWAFEPMSEADFVARILDGQPVAPPYFGAMKKRNRDNPVTLGSVLPRRLSAEQLSKILDEDLFVLDVRNEDEWARGHVAQATLIPLPHLHDRLGELPRDRAIVVHCQHGQRSGTGAATLDAFGFDNVHLLAGGFAGWEAAGFAIAR